MDPGGCVRERRITLMSCRKWREASATFTGSRLHQMCRFSNVVIRDVNDRGAESAVYVEQATAHRRSPFGEGLRVPLIWP